MLRLSQENIHRRFKLLQSLREEPTIAATMTRRDFLMGAGKYWAQNCWKKIGKKKMSEWKKHQKTKLPKWCGERPGKKADDPASPEEEEEDIKMAVGEEIEEIEDIGNVEEEEDIE